MHNEDTFSPSESDLNKANARHTRAQEIDDLERNTSLIRSDAATVVDLGGPVCSLCGERIPRREVEAHVQEHLAA